jgi:hypothetical protein
MSLHPDDMPDTYTDESVGMFSQNPDKWFDYEFKTTNLDLNNDMDLKEQWGKLTEAQKWEEIEMTYRCISDSSIIINNQTETIEALKVEVKALGGTWNDAVIGESLTNNGKPENN